MGRGPRRLNVHWGGYLVGRLWVDEKNDFVFQYDSGWLEGKKAIPLSVRLPLQKEPFDDNSARIFFANLLPEGDVREAITRLYQISPGNNFKLLEILGGECAGAVSLVPEGKKPDSGGSYVPLPWEELDRMIDRMPQYPLLTAKGELRLSLAGAQHKLPVFVKGQELYLPKGSYASSHILKPQIERFKNTVENEGFCMALAKECGLPVAGASIWKQARHAVLLVERYDRQLGGDTPARLHQEDFCQALGFSYERKYESEGGPRLKDCFALLDAKSFQPMVDKKNLLNWVIFNYLVGNCDAHAKNISLLITREGFRLAPFYDLLSTVVYEKLAKEPAMKVGGGANIGNFTKKHWERLADEAGVGPKAVFTYGENLAGQLPSAVKKIFAEFISEYGAQWIVEGISRHITKYSGSLLKALKQYG
ncbi:MAG: type II toxin-antitoxin system HipA family toxin [Elusimicrobia bacterium]|nr:type II toxin-antitoxin system HipA family toxin [Elusimicrobiota bacterium]